MWTDLCTTHQFATASMAFLRRLHKQLRCLRHTGGQHELNIAAGLCRYCGRQWSTLYPPPSAQADNVAPSPSVPPTPQRQEPLAATAPVLRALRSLRVSTVPSRLAPAAILLAIVLMSYGMWSRPRESALPTEDSSAQFEEPAKIDPAAPPTLARMAASSANLIRPDLPVTAAPKVPAPPARKPAETSDTVKGPTTAARAARAPVGKTAKAKVAGDAALPRGTSRTAETLDGWWILTNEVLLASEQGLKPLHLRFRVQLKQQGDRVTGRGEKWTENGRPIPLNDRTPVTVVGRVDGPSLALTFTEPVARGTSGGTSLLMRAGDGVLRGSFTSARSRSRGSSIAWRMR